MISAMLVGWIMSVFVRACALKLLRFSLFAGFYRTNTGRANLISLVLEAWSLSLSFGFILARTIKLILISIFYIGRNDTPLLAPGVGVIRNFPLDNQPTAHFKDILSKDAHRHPYIERLGLLYLLKIRLGSRFGNRAGATWRILFASALMPWLRDAYRVNSVGKMHKYQDLSQLSSQFLKMNKLQLEVEGLRKERTKQKALEEANAKLTKGASKLEGQRLSEVMARLALETENSKLRAEVARISEELELERNRQTSFY